MCSCEECFKHPFYPDKKCCFNCGKQWNNCGVWHNCGSDCPEWRTITNADRIRAMSDEELAEFISTKLNDDFYDWPDLTLRWLQQPAENYIENENGEH